MGHPFNLDAQNKWNLMTHCLFNESDEISKRKMKKKEETFPKRENFFPPEQKKIAQFDLHRDLPTSKKKVEVDYSQFFFLSGFEPIIFKIVSFKIR